MRRPMVSGQPSRGSADTSLWWNAGDMTSPWRDTGHCLSLLSFSVHLKLSCPVSSYLPGAPTRSVSFLIPCLAHLLTPGLFCPGPASPPAGQAFQGGHCHHHHLPGLHIFVSRPTHKYRLLSTGFLCEQVKSLFPSSPDFCLSL